MRPLSTVDEQWPDDYTCSSVLDHLSLFTSENPDMQLCIFKWEQQSYSEIGRNCKCHSKVLSNIRTTGSYFSTQVNYLPGLAKCDTDA